MMKTLPAEIDTLISGADNMVRQIDHRSQDSFLFAREVRKPGSALELMLTWCKKELQGDWRWQLVEMSSDPVPGRYIFYFDSDRDVVAFTMKWC